MLWTQRLYICIFCIRNGGYLMNKTNNPIALQSKESIRKALIKAMHEFPYDEITIKHILIEAGVTRRTFYRNFDNKDDVLHSCLDEISVAFISVFQDSENSGNPQYLCDSFMKIMEEYKDILHVLTTHGMESLLFYKVDSRVLNYNALLPDNTSKTSFSVNEYKQIYRIGGTLNVLFSWLFYGQHEPLYQIIESITVK